MSERKPSPEEWERITELFMQALELPTAERPEWLASLEREYPDLRDEVAALLEAGERPGPLPSGPRCPEVGGCIGPYRLVTLLGVGGMGVVYLAERAGWDFTQRVALKLIRAGYADPQLEERLRRERGILARLEHPAIARFIDGGTTETGQSYFAMEYVDGIALRAFCAATGATVRRRLELFLEVCGALQHAHQELVIHGDLKPANILVTATGRVKLLDFGIAELLEHSPSPEGENRTLPWLTPAYASPEQVLGQRLTTQADVYALGVVLYELLTGQRPYEIQGRAPSAIARQIREANPPPPSAVASPPARARELRGDLDAIVRKAMDPEPARRYASVEQLATDVRRYFDGRPVEARPPTAAYRFSRFVLRRRASVTAATVILVSLLAATAVSVRQAAIARHQRDRANIAAHRAEAVSEFLIGLFQQSDPRVTQGDTLAARALLRLGQARAEELEGLPVVQGRVLDALGRVNLSLGRVDEAETLFQESRRIREGQLGPQHPDLALSYVNLADIFRRRLDLASAESLMVRAIALERSSLGDQDPQLGQTLMNAASLAVYEARLGEAERRIREALAIDTVALEPDHPQTAEATRILGSILRRQGRHGEAEEAYREYLAIQTRRTGPESPETAEAMVHLADLEGEVLGRPQVAESLYRRSLRIQERSLGPGHMQLVHARGSLADLLVRRRAFGEAESLLRQNLHTVIGALGERHDAVANLLASLAEVARSDGRPDEAATLAQRSMALVRELHGPDSPALAGPLTALASARLAQGRQDEALALARRLVELRRRSSGTRHPLYGSALVFLARVNQATGRRTAAESLATRALAVLRQVTSDSHPDVRAVRQLLVDLDP